MDHFPFLPIPENGADASLCDSDGHNVLHKAVEGGKVEVVKYLLDKGARNGAPKTNRMKGLDSSLASALDVRGRTAKDLIPSNKTDILSLFDNS